VYVIVRTENAGAFAGEIDRDLDQYRTIKLSGARRLWYWDGAASLSGLAATGTSKPGNCKFPAAVTVTLTDVIEVIEVSDDARKSIESVPVWTA
jgi:hypothetical protein